MFLKKEDYNFYRTSLKLTFGSQEPIVGIARIGLDDHYVF